MEINEHKAQDNVGDGDHLSVPKTGLTRTMSYTDTKSLVRNVKRDSMVTTTSETDLHRYFLSPVSIRRSVSVNEFSSPLSVRVNLSDDEVFEFPHTRSPISLKVILEISYLQGYL